MKIFKNKFFLFGNLLLLLITIPLILFFVKQQTKVSTKAAATTQLTITPATATAAINSTVKVDVMVNPSQNIVSIVDMYLTYDPAVLQIISKDDIVVNTAAFPTVLRGPIFSPPGTINLSLNIGSDVNHAIQTPAKVATITFHTIAKTPSGPTQISFDNTQSRVFSLAQSDQPGENVLANTQPAAITVVDAASLTPTITGSITPTAGTLTPAPTSVTATGVAPTQVPKLNQTPLCTSLVTDRTASGTAPLSLAFTGSATDSDGTLSKATFSFGDGAVQTVTVGGGLGTGQANVQIAHTFNNPGTFTASVSFTDNSGGISAANTACSLGVTVSAPAPTASTGGGSSNGSSNGGSSGGSTGNNNGGAPRPTMRPTGSTATTVGIIGGVVLTILGGAALLLL